MMIPGFKPEDLEQITDHGATVENISDQINRFIKGFGHLEVVRAATVNDGIRRLTEGQVDDYGKIYLSAAASKAIVKFVPASGAATRMFKEFYEYRDKGIRTGKIQELEENIGKLAFYDKIKGEIDSGSRTITDAVISYGGSLPKALIDFHRYGDEVRTALEEHLTEGALYAMSCGYVNIHFTLSEEHKEKFLELIGKVTAKYQKRFDTRYNITFSQQLPQTDTIAVTMDNEPFRDDLGRLVFRPAGHGALIHNLNKIESDMIFIKNIDNVTTDRFKADTIRYKMAMGGLVTELQERIANYIRTIRDGGTIPSADTYEFIEKELGYKFPESHYRLSEQERKIDVLAILDRPVRVCAMVKNEGEPGGGPFWVKNGDGSVSLQIGEPSQIAEQDRHYLKNGTHFNPADIVCGVRGHEGKKFDLLEYVDPATGFISEKTKDGKKLKALELPGLWNGSMANWNTMFLEVPVSTFTPVKEVNDLLRPQHQND